MTWFEGRRAARGANSSQAAPCRLGRRSCAPSANRRRWPPPARAKITGGRMRRVGKNSFTEIYFRGCNPSFIETSDGYVMIDSPQQPIDAVRWRERMEEKAPIRYLINTEPHGDHIAGNAYFPGVTVVGQVKLKENFERYLNQSGTLAEKRERMKQADPDSVWLMGHPDY